MNLNMNIKELPCIQEEKERLEHLLHLSFGADLEMRAHGIRSFSKKNTLVRMIAELDGVMFGAISAWNEVFHPYATYIFIVVHPAWQEQHIEGELLEKVMKHVGDKFPIQTSLWETSYALRDFYEREGFKEIRRTYITSLQVADEAVQERVKLYQEQFEAEAEDVCIKNFTDIPKSSELHNQLIDLVRDTYERTHHANPLGVLDPLTWENLVYAEDTLLDGSFVMIQGGVIQAYAILHGADQSDICELGWRGCAEGVGLHTIRILSAYQLAYAKQLGCTKVEAEMDTTSPYALELLRGFPFEPSPTWITFQKRT